MKINFIKIFFLPALVAGILMFAGGCSSKPHYKIGVSQPSIDEWRTQMNEEILREVLFHDDVEVEIRSADDDTKSQVDDIRYFIDNGFDAIIASPRQTDTISSVIAEAYDRGIPVIVFDRAVSGTKYTTYIELDNRGIGQEAAKFVASLAQGKPLKVAEIRGLVGSTPAEERHHGFKEIIQSAEGVEFVASASGSWTAKGASRITDSLLKLHPEINIIYAQNDVMAIAAAETARRLGREDIKVIGTDAAAGLGVKAVADSVIEASFIYPTDGQNVLRCAIDILRGQTPPKVQHVAARFPVNPVNAPLLLRQDELLRDKTSQIEALQKRNLVITERHRIQFWFVVAAAVAVVAMVAMVIMMWRNGRQRRRYEAELQAANNSLRNEHARQKELYDQLQEATRSKLIFFTNVSHDLRTPLTLIYDPLQQVALSPRLNDQEASLMQIALRNAGILRRLIDQILDFRRFQNGMTSLKLSRIDLRSQLKEWSESFISVAAKRRLALDIDLSGLPEGSEAQLDAEKLERVVFNLLSNALKYTPAGSVTFTAAISENRLIISVSDSGIGISEEDCRLIFERFYQVDKVRPTGSGIGLSLTKAFVELMGGSIKVESELGRGSKFTVDIPLKLMQSDRQEKPLSPSPELVPISLSSSDVLEQLDSDAPASKELNDDLPVVLVIDDNSDILEMVKEMLDGKYNVVTARDGETGWKLAMRYVPDIVLCDIMMPGIDGFETTRRIKEEQATSHVPVLMLTACRLDEQRVQSYDSGADAFISKPFELSLLLSRIESLLKNRIRIRDYYSVMGFTKSKNNGDSTAESRLPSTNDPLEIENEFYRSFIEVVRRRYSDSELSLQDVATDLALGQTQLTRKIKALTGMSPVDIIRNIRLHKARQLLLTTSDTISEIAYVCGFSSPQYFSRCFRDYYNMTPSQLRNADNK